MVTRTRGLPLCWLLLLASASVPAATAEPERNNWVVLVDTSRYWYNYRHSSNVLTFYHTVKRLGIPDSHIILMVAEDAACNARNSAPGKIFNDHVHGTNLYGEDVEVDYRGDEVSTENFLRLLSGRHPPETPRGQRLLTDSMSNLLVYVTGHSGNGFIKFQDWEELTSTDIADAFSQMHKQRRYNKVFWISDTCQAATLQHAFYAPGVIAIGSSKLNENSYSHHTNREIGVALVDRFTYFSSEYFGHLSTSSKNTINDYFRFFDPQKLHANPEMRTDLFGARANETRLTEFLAATGRMRFQSSSLQLRPTGDASCPDPTTHLAAARPPRSDDSPREPEDGGGDLGRLARVAAFGYDRPLPTAGPGVALVVPGAAAAGNLGRTDGFDAGPSAAAWLLGCALLAGASSAIL